MACHFFMPGRPMSCQSLVALWIRGTLPVWKRFDRSQWLHDATPEKPMVWWYGGWKKSCTTLDGWNPINNGINHLSTGAGFLPSTVCWPKMCPYWWDPKTIFSSKGMAGDGFSWDWYLWNACQCECTLEIYGDLERHLSTGKPWWDIPLLTIVGPWLIITMVDIYIYIIYI